MRGPTGKPDVRGLRVGGGKVAKVAKVANFSGITPAGALGSGAGSQIPIDLPLPLTGPEPNPCEGSKLAGRSVS